MPRTFVPIIRGATLDRPDENDTVATAKEIAAVLERAGVATEIVVVGIDMGALVSLADRRPSAVFNLVEAINGDAALSHLPCAVMEHLGIVYTGARATAYTLSLFKPLTKDRLAARGLPTASWWANGAGIPAGQSVIIKSMSEHASVGIDQGSIVDGADAADEIARRERRFGGRFFAETYLPGREFNVAILERRSQPEGLPVQEIVFDALPAGHHAIVDFEAKWDPASVGYRHTPRRFGLEAREPKLALRLADLALACWDAFDLSGYARIDMRLDGDGAPHILEVNANPCLASDAGLAATAAAAGMTYDDLVLGIVHAAAPERAYAA